MLNRTLSPGQSSGRIVRSLSRLALSAVFSLAAFALLFWGYPLNGMNFSDFHFYERDLPLLWGLSIVNPQTHRISYAFLFHNEGLMTLLYFLLNGLPLDVPAKQVFVNGFSIGLQFLNVLLFFAVLWRLVGSSYLFPYLVLFLLYPFAAANHYWQACIPNNLAATFFLASILFFLYIEYVPGKLGRNLAFRILPSFALLWCSIITVEWAICLSPLYVYLALYYSNGRTAVLRFKQRVTPYSTLACLFLLTSILPVFLFTGHRLTVFSYAARFNELAEQVQWTASLITAAVIIGNGALTLASFLFANTLGVIVYPLTALIRHMQALAAWPLGVAVGLVAVTALGVVGLKRATRVGSGVPGGREERPDFRFLMTLGFLWMALAYFPFLLSFGYPRNVGLTADRINALGGMGAVLVLSSGLVWFRGRWGDRIVLPVSAALIALLLVNIQIQKFSYVEASRKEEALIAAVFAERERIREREMGTEPIFLLHRESRMVSPRVQLRRVLQEPAVLGKVGGLTSFMVGRYFTVPTVSTSFHFNGIFFFGCCPQTAAYTFDFYADWRGVPRPLVYKWEDPFTLTEESDRFTLGYPPTQVWEDRSQPGEFHSFSKREHQLVVLDIGESTFDLGAPLVYEFRPYQGSGA